MNRCSVLSTIVLSLFFSPFALAQVNVGDTPKLAFKATDGRMVDLAALKGKYVVIDFWATWCGPCMAEAEHMVQINEQYGKRGMAFIGISLDADLAAMKQVCAEKNFDWPQYFDGKGWGNSIAQSWGVRSVPKTFLIDLEGKVLWVGHPAQIDRELKAAFDNNPPVLMDEKALASAKAAIADVEKQLAAKNPGAALKAMGTVPEVALADTRTSEQVKKLQEQITSAAEAMLAEVDPLIEKKDYPGALSRLRDISVSLRGTDVGTQAQEKLNELSKNPAVQAALAEVEKARKAQVELTAARQLQSAKQHEQAYARFKVIATTFAGTPASTEASTEVANYEKDTAFMNKMNEAAIASKARSAISLAKAYAGSGKPDLAAKKLQGVIDDYPGTSFAEEAKKELAALKR